MREKLTDAKVVLITRKTRLENLVIRYNTVEQAKFYIEHMGCDFSDYVKEDAVYKKAVFEITDQIEKIAHIHVIDRDFVPNYIFADNDIVIAVGQDGLVANTLKYLNKQPLIGINPDPERWDGVLLPFQSKDTENVLKDVIKNVRRYKEVTLAKAELNDGQILYAVNDLFIGQKTHVSARYTIKIKNKSEQQSSSGIIISTGLGSTGWLKSILVGASRVTAGFSQEQLDLSDKRTAWDADTLWYSVREPYPSKWTQAGIVFGTIGGKETLLITSQMAENGVIFSDGIENDYLQFNSGTEVTVKIAEKKGRLII